MCVPRKGGSSVLLLGALILIILGLDAACAQPSSQGELEGFDVVAENEHLVLYLNAANTEIAVQDRETNAVWYSNPPHRNVRDTIARGEMKERLNSQLLVSYYTPGDRLITINNYTESVRYNQYQITPIDTGVRIEYLLGKQWEDDAYLPVFIDQDCLEQLASQLADERDRQLLSKHYALMQLVETGPDYEPVQVAQVDAAQVFGNYTVTDPRVQGMSSSARQKLINSLLDKIVTYRSDVKNRQSIAAAHIPQRLKERAAYVLNSGLLPWDVQDLVEVFRRAGLDPRLTEEQHRNYGIDPPRENPLVFRVPIEYTLEGDALVVRIPAGEIDWRVDVPGPSGGETETYLLYKIQVLEYFGAMFLTDEGYLFVPDGSGGLINLPRAPGDHGTYERPVYGEDPAITGMKPQVGGGFLEQVHLPVYGIKAQERALFAIIEDGDAFASISVNTAGRVNSYSSVSPQFTVVPKSEASLQGSVSHRVRQQTVNIYQPRPYQGDIRIRYLFLTGSEAGYVGMAGRYKQYLIDSGQLRDRVPAPEGQPLLLDITCGITRRKSILGIPVLQTERLTSYRQVKSVVGSLMNQGISHIDVRLVGWMGGGIEHGFPDRVRVDSALGSREDLRELIDYLHENSIGLYPEVNLLNVYRNGLFDSFIVWTDAARFLNKKVARIGQARFPDLLTSPVRYHYILSPHSLGRLIDAVAEDYRRLQICGLASTDLGMQLSSDFRVNRLIDRQQSLGTLCSELRKLSDSGFSLLAGGGNAYVLPYLSRLIQAPARASGFSIIDESIPFYQLVVHGHLFFSYQPFNLGEDPKWLMLRSAETGAVPYYSLTYEDASLTKNTEFDYLFATSHKDWAARVADCCRRINAVLEGTWDQGIINHEQLQPGVYRTTFESGTTVIVNYNPQPVQIGELVIDGESFARGPLWGVEE